MEGSKEFNEVKQAIIADRKQVQKWANRAAGGKLSINDLKRLQLSLLCLIDNEEHFHRVKAIKRKEQSLCHNFVTSCLLSPNKLNSQYDYLRSPYIHRPDNHSGHILYNITKEIFSK